MGIVFEWIWFPSPAHGLLITLEITVVCIGIGFVSNYHLPWHNAYDAQWLRVSASIYKYLIGR